MIGAANYIVFQCYGYDRVFYECAYALLSLSRVYDNRLPDDLQVWVYTDKPERFNGFKNCPFSVNCREVNTATIKQWRGAIDFVHRVKIELLKDFTAGRTGNILYCDTDVVFCERPDEMLCAIGEERRYMHIMEGRVSEEGNPIFRKLNEHLKKEPTLKVNGIPMNELPMWNAGVLGFNTQDANKLNEVLRFTDEQYPKFPKHVVEQFAFSVYFSYPGEIKTAAPWLIHYWNLKEAGTVLASFFNYFKDAPWHDLVRYSLLVQIPALMQEKINFYQGRSLAGKIRKKQWTPAIVDWEAMKKQL